MGDFKNIFIRSNVGKIVGIRGHVFDAFAGLMIIEIVQSLDNKFSTALFNYAVDYRDD